MTRGLFDREKVEPLSEDLQKKLIVLSDAWDHPNPTPITHLRRRHTFITGFLTGAFTATVIMGSIFFMMIR